MRYEFTCSECGLVAEFPVRDPIDGHEIDCGLAPGVAGGDRCSGTWKRRWSFGIAWPVEARGH